MRRVAGGWTVNGITTLQKGAPLVINVASSQLKTGTANRANITCTDVDRPKLVQYFNTGCFAPRPRLSSVTPASGTFVVPGLWCNWVSC